MRAFKGFNRDMTCRGFQYTEGGEYETETADLCKSGFHACEAPLDLFRYYGPAESVYREVEVEEVDPKRGDDSKVAARKIRIGAQVSLAGLAQAHVEYVFERVDRSIEQTVAGGTASNTGDYSAASVSGSESIAVVTGLGSRAAGGEGCWIVLTERDDDWHILGVKAVRVGSKVNGQTIKAGVYYELVGGKVAESGTQS